MNLLRKTLKKYDFSYDIDPIYSEFREGDVLHSLADINKAKVNLGYDPKFNVESGLFETLKTYIKD